MSKVGKGIEYIVLLGAFYFYCKGTDNFKNLNLYSWCFKQNLVKWGYQLQILNVALQVTCSSLLHNLVNTRGGEGGTQNPNVMYLGISFLFVLLVAIWNTMAMLLLFPYRVILVFVGQIGLGWPNGLVINYFLNMVSTLNSRYKWLRVCIHLW